jgi:hypothetical protein
MATNGVSSPKYAAPERAEMRTPSVFSTLRQPASAKSRVETVFLAAFSDFTLDAAVVNADARCAATLERGGCHLLRALSEISY